MKHTQGKWTSESEFGLDVFAIDENGVKISHIANCGNYQGDNEFTAQKAANAKLIAAAPELLEALQSLHSVVMQSDDRKIFDNGKNYETVAKAFEVIKKATDFEVYSKNIGYMKPDFIFEYSRP